MYCRFENRITQKALVLEQLVERILVYDCGQLEQAWARIEAAQSEGHWVALVLNYELGAHLLQLPSAAVSTQPLLSAYIMQEAHQAKVWEAPKSKPLLTAKALLSRQRYLDDIAHIQQGIKNGDYYQINYSMPIAITSEATPQQIYQYLAHAHPVPYGAYISDPLSQRHLLCFSPELFVQRSGDQVTVKPMKGTTARHVEPIKDKAAAKALRRSEKDVAENIMIVDLLRNDLGRIASIGSVHVSQLLEVEAYPSVWTMTSTIQAEIKDKRFATLMQALFPCGSITGTPKIAAMRCIQELERRQRGVYCGSIGWLAPNGDLQLNVAIRTIEYPGISDSAHQGAAHFGVGGAIVIDSDPAQEWQECLWKARVLGVEIETY